MICDGILKAVIAFPNFDPTKTRNPFGYFTQVIFNEFRKRIKLENTQRKAREGLIMISPIFDVNEFDADSNITKDQMIGNFEFNSGG